MRGSLRLRGKAQAAKDRAVGKRAATEGASQRTKRKKTTPLSFALSESEADESNRSGSGTHHSASPLNTIIPNEGELATRGDGLILEPVNQMGEDTDQPLDNAEDTTEVNSPLSEHSPRFQQSNPSDEDTQNVRSEPAHTHASGSISHGVSSTSGGSHCRAFPVCHSGGDGAALYGEKRVSNQLLDTVRSRNQLSEDHKVLQQREEHIKQLEADLASKISSLTEAEGIVDTLKGDLERLTVDLSQAEIVRHNYVRQLLPNVVQRLLSSDEYKKSLSDVFNLAIAARWSKGVKAACSEEEA
ncbi:hypothetical protein Tco_0833020 [Tanacetum coccineum]